MVIFEKATFILVELNFEAVFLKEALAKCPGVSYICTFVTLEIENGIKWINNS